MLPADVNQQSINCPNSSEQRAESSEAMIPPPDSVEGAIIFMVRWVKLGVEIFGAGLVTLGVIMAIAHLVRTFAAKESLGFTTTRLILARHLALALEFELGADILGTAVSPSWDQIGKLGAVAVIRTGLNFFLTREMQGQQAGEKERVQLSDRPQPQVDESTQHG